MYDDKLMHHRIHTSWQIAKIVRDIFIPFGVPRGSDMQGGQTQGTNAPNQFPVDHVTSMLMDGKCINLINMWRKHDISAGDDMILVLRKMVPGDYVLSRQSNSYNRQRFADLPTNAQTAAGTVDLEERRKAGVWQLVPWIYNTVDESPTPSEYDYRENGYWHICRALQMFSADPRFMYDNYNDATQYRTTGELMEVSFQPLFIEGISGGSSQFRIRKRDLYPIDREMTGIRFRNILSNAPGGMMTVGPSQSDWKVFLENTKKNRENKKRMNEYAQNDYNRNVVQRRTYIFGDNIADPNIADSNITEVNTASDTTNDPAANPVAGNVHMSISASYIDMDHQNVNVDDDTVNSGHLVVTQGEAHGGDDNDNTNMTTSSNAKGKSKGIAGIMGSVRASLIGSPSNIFVDTSSSSSTNNTSTTNNNTVMEEGDGATTTTTSSSTAAETHLSPKETTTKSTSKKGSKSSSKMSGGL